MNTTVLMDALGWFLAVCFTPLIWMGTTLVALRDRALPNRPESGTGGVVLSAP